MCIFYILCVCLTVEQVISGPRYYLLINKVIVEMSVIKFSSLYFQFKMAAHITLPSITASLQFIWLLFLPPTSDKKKNEAHGSKM